MTCHFRPTCFESYSSGASASRFPSLNDPAGAVASSTPLATSVQRALGQVFFEDVDALWNELRREIAGKQELASQPTHF